MLIYVVIIFVARLSGKLRGDKPTEVFLFTRAALPIETQPVTPIPARGQCHFEVSKKWHHAEQDMRPRQCSGY